MMNAQTSESKNKSVCQSSCCEVIWTLKGVMLMTNLHIISECSHLSAPMDRWESGFYFHVYVLKHKKTKVRQEMQLHAVVSLLW